MVPFSITLSDVQPRFQGHGVTIDDLRVLCVLLTRDLFAIVVVVVVVVVEMNIIKVALSHFCCRTTVQSDSVSVARQVTVRRW